MTVRAACQVSPPVDTIQWNLLRRRGVRAHPAGHRCLGLLSRAPAQASGPPDHVHWAWARDLKRDFQGGGAPKDTRTEAYSRLVQNLEVSLSIALRTAVVDLNNRGDSSILPEVLPSTKDFTDEQWLKWLSDQLGPEPPTY